MIFANIGLPGILSLRRQNRPISEAVNYYQKIEPLSSDYIASIHILRLCFENGIPYSNREIRRFCKSVYTTDMGGDPKQPGFYMTIQRFTKDCLKYAGKYKITFKVAKKSIIPKNNPAEIPIKQKFTGVLTQEKGKNLTYQGKQEKQPKLSVFVGGWI